MIPVMNELEEKVREVICRNCSRHAVEQVRNVREIEQKLQEMILEQKEVEVNALQWVLFKREEL
jgi:hypothetical protein